MMEIEKKINRMGIQIPEAAKPLASYVPFRRVGNLIYISGQDCCVNGKLKYEGKVGADVTEGEYLRRFSNNGNGGKNKIKFKEYVINKLIF